MTSGGASPMPAAPGAPTPVGPSGLSAVAASGSPAASTKTKFCVYCGSSSGNNPAYMEAARQLARVMAENDIGLVYGGGTVGLMGELARSLVALAGPDAVHGIIPEALVRYERDPNYTSRAAKAALGDTGGPAAAAGDDAAATAAAAADDDGLAVPDEALFGKTTVVPDMHTRKRLMAQEVLRAGPGSGFVALSGGYGTFEELLETSTWNQLGIHNRGVCVLNINGFYDGLFAWIRTSVREGFISEGNAHIIAEAKAPADVVLALRDYKVSPSVLKLAWGKE